MFQLNTKCGSWKLEHQPATRVARMCVWHTGSNTRRVFLFENLDQRYSPSTSSHFQLHGGFYPQTWQGCTPASWVISVHSWITHMNIPNWKPQSKHLNMREENTTRIPCNVCNELWSQYINAVSENRPHFHKFNTNEGGWSLTKSGVDQHLRTQCHTINKSQ